MKIAMIGLRGCGKTTIFNSLTKGEKDGNIAVVKVPDKRLDTLYNLYPAKRKVSCEIEFIDLCPVEEGMTDHKSFDKQFLSFLRNIDAIALVIKCFSEEIEPIKDVNTILGELLLSDLLIAEKKLSSLEPKGKKMTQELEREKGLIERCRNSLSNEIPIRKLALNDEEKKILSSYQFLTDKSITIVGNIGEKMLNPQKIEQLKEYAKTNEMPLVMLCAKFEKDLIELEEDEREAFRKELKIENGISNLIRLVYDTLSLISFFTIGKDEVRGWAISKGTNALKAAGKIHSDIERGFIKASVISYDDLIDCGSMQHARDKGKIRLFGKDYIVKNGDIIEFKFNV